MKSFELQEHTADIRLKLKASSMTEIFEVGLEGMNSIIMPSYSPVRSNNIIKETIVLTAMDEVALLIDFLSEVLTATHIHKVLFYEVKIKALGKANIEATIVGEPVEQFEDDIKAVTYHEADITELEDGSFEAMIIFDI